MTDMGNLKKLVVRYFADEPAAVDVQGVLVVREDGRHERVSFRRTELLDGSVGAVVSARELGGRR